jgi:pyridoxamine 5'-phosphate oxidase
MKDLGNYRKTYTKNELLEQNLLQNPIDLFQQWFKEVEQAGGVDEVNAMSISSIGIDGFPKTRIVLLKEITNHGFLFYTNYDSEKGKAISKNPKVCLSFFWPNLERQVIIKGEAQQATSAVSDAYFASRPKGSQLGAIASNQSETVPSRVFLDEKLDNLTQKYADFESIPRPENWGGFLVIPTTIEFWQGRPNRMHDRIRFSNQTDEKWVIERLSP